MSSSQKSGADASLDASSPRKSRPPSANEKAEHRVPSTTTQSNTAGIGANRRSETVKKSLVKDILSNETKGGYNALMGGSHEYEDEQEDTAEHHAHRKEKGVSIKQVMGGGNGKEAMGILFGNSRAEEEYELVEPTLGKHRQSMPFVNRIMTQDAKEGMNVLFGGGDDVKKHKK
ncbi:hypothetical protein BC830DRAFT_1171379 [Chytriomyces sp. MP71]|nr:hypothetical protein BC830DRAFT_1171379 [Chytriomyces sp. MP71]